VIRELQADTSLCRQALRIICIANFASEWRNADGAAGPANTTALAVLRDSACCRSTRRAGRGGSGSSDRGGAGISGRCGAGRCAPVECDAEITDNEIGGACKGLGAGLDTLYILSACNTLIVDEVLEEAVQVGSETVDITRGGDKRVDVPIGVWARPQIPGVSAYADPGQDLTADGLNASKTR